MCFILETIFLGQVIVFFEVNKWTFQYFLFYHINPDTHLFLLHQIPALIFLPFLVKWSKSV